MHKSIDIFFCNKNGSSDNGFIQAGFKLEIGLILTNGSSFFESERSPRFILVIKLLSIVVRSIPMPNLKFDLLILIC